MVANHYMTRWLNKSYWLCLNLATWRCLIPKNSTRCCSRCVCHKTATRVAVALYNVQGYAPSQPEHDIQSDLFPGGLLGSPWRPRPWITNSMGLGLFSPMGCWWSMMIPKKKRCVFFPKKIGWRGDARRNSFCCTTPSESRVHWSSWTSVAQGRELCQAPPEHRCIGPKETTQIAQHSDEDAFTSWFTWSIRLSKTGASWAPSGRRWSDRSIAVWNSGVRASRPSCWNWMEYAGTSPEKLEGILQSLQRLDRSRSGLQTRPVVLQLLSPWPETVWWVLAVADWELPTCWWVTARPGHRGT